MKLPQQDGRIRVASRWIPRRHLPQQTALAVLFVGIVPAGLASADEVISPAALAQCAQAGVAECQFRYAQHLEQNTRRDNAAEIRALYEGAYRNGYEPAGAAILQLIERRASATAAVPSNVTQATAKSAHESPTVEQGFRASANPFPGNCYSLAIVGIGNELAEQASSDQSCGLHVSLRVLSVREGILTLEAEFQNASPNTLRSRPVKIQAEQSGVKLSVKDSRAADALLTGVKVLSDVAASLPLWQGASLLSRAAVERNLASTAVDTVADSARGQFETESSAHTIRLGPLSSRASKSHLVTFVLKNDSDVDFALDVGGVVRRVKFNLSM